MAITRRKQGELVSEADIKRELEREIDSAQRKLLALEAKAGPKDRARLELKVIGLKAAKKIIGHEFML